MTGEPGNAYHVRLKFNFRQQIENVKRLSKSVAPKINGSKDIAMEYEDQQNTSQ